MASASKVIRRADYAPPAYLVPRVSLAFRLDVAVADGKRVCEVDATLTLTPNAAGAPQCWALEDAPDLVLHAEDLDLLGVDIDGVALGSDDYFYDRAAEVLTVHGARLAQALARDSAAVLQAGASFRLTSRVRGIPENNLQLQGLFCSSGVFCTQCEAEGFRRIAPCLDRPDVLSVYSVRLEAPRIACPVLLSNGNKVASGLLDAERHFACFDDPYPKPTYLFAAVAGKLWSLDDTFTTSPSGRKVAISLYSDKEAQVGDLAFALASVKLAMKWDEEQFGREYDLDVFSVVAVADFNMGAMENKGLNVFNSKYVLANPSTSSDSALRLVQGIVAHEYFHNWTGNRVTLKDWFQLTLKEGLTVYRDQRFTADQADPTVKRIADVRTVRSLQWPEDDSPLAHAVRPDTYVKMDNFYTRTVYRKGAEVVRLYETLLGRGGFRKGTDLYFHRHDGQAVTCDEFRAAMADANDEDADGVSASAADRAFDGWRGAGVPGASALIRSEAFGRWYSQAGTPTLTVEAAGLMSVKLTPPGSTESCAVYRLVLSQATPKGQPLLLPVAAGLVPSRGDGALELALVRKRDLSPASGTAEFFQKPVTKPAMAAAGGQAAATAAVFVDSLVLILGEEKAEFLIAVRVKGRTASGGDFDVASFAPVVSLLRGWSCPVKLKFPSQSVDDLEALMTKDADGFARFEASNRFATKVIVALSNQRRRHALAASSAPSVPEGSAAAAAEDAAAAAAEDAAEDASVSALLGRFVGAWGAVFDSRPSFAGKGELHLLSLMLRLPGDVEVLNAGGIKADGRTRKADGDADGDADGGADGKAAREASEEVLDAGAVAAAKRSLWELLGSSRLSALPAAFEEVQLPRGEPYELTASHEGRRCLSLCLLSLWCAGEAAGSRAQPRSDLTGLAALVAHCRGATNMTDRSGALSLLAGRRDAPSTPEVADALAAYDADFGDHRDAVDAWFSCQAAHATGAASLKALMAHRAFSLTAPNKVRAVFSVLASLAPSVLQEASVLELLGQVVCDVDATNGNLAASLCKMLAQWRRWPAEARAGAKAVLERALARPGCSKNTAEVAALALS